ncbi:hypothetical protein [Saccharomonospora cyanea]|uniref:Uncharacterized protein n=1 Tax=Saccharomonospora cyanea NA-134 TaxID=882082 RepID=H5XKC4_9PSEU|nr:hypothetical protein [Saccharomonospora cyanea]EHR59757.1 hypothetical protein SaccyDRAFT_0835 [Saccharomonospora cyanea NA-134]
MPDVRDFRRACYAVARRTGGEIVGFHLATGVAPNFHQGLIAYPDRTVAVVCTRDSAILAVAEPRAVDRHTESGPLTFVDRPELSAVLAELPGFRVLTRSELDAQFDAAAWPDVLAEDVRYWRPTCLGEALFNYWD